MQMIEIIALDNGAHNNQTYHGVLPEGWAVIPEGMETTNFPFGEVVAEEVDGVMTATHWYPLPIPEPEPEPIPDNPEPTSDELWDILLGDDDDE